MSEYNEFELPDYDFEDEETTDSPRRRRTKKEELGFIIPKELYEIQEEFLKDNSDVKKIVFHDDVKKIGKNAFSGCEKLKEIEFSDSIIEIEEEAFSGCIKLETVTLPESLSKIGKEAFSGCKSLKTIIILSQIEQLPEAVFKDCINLKEVTLPEKLIKIGKETFRNCCKLPEIILPEHLAEIDEKAFYGCKELKSISIPIGVTEIKDKVFFDCENLENVKLPDTLETIGVSAFEGCSLGLKTITIPENTQLLKDRAFARCGALEEITLNKATDTGTYLDTFHKCYNLNNFNLYSSNLLNTSTDNIPHNEESELNLPKEEKSRNSNLPTSILTLVSLGEIIEKYFINELKLTEEKILVIDKELFESFLNELSKKENKSLNEVQKNLKKGLKICASSLGQSENEDAKKYKAIAIAAFQVHLLYDIEISGDDNDIDTKYNKKLCEYLEINVNQVYKEYWIDNGTDELWQFLKEKFNVMNVPAPKTGTGRYVQYPKSQKPNFLCGKSIKTFLNEQRNLFISKKLKPKLSYDDFIEKMNIKPNSSDIESSVKVRLIHNFYTKWDGSSSVAYKKTQARTIKKPSEKPKFYIEFKNETFTFHKKIDGNRQNSEKPFHEIVSDFSGKMTVFYKDGSWFYEISKNDLKEKEKQIESLLVFYNTKDLIEVCGDCKKNYNGYGITKDENIAFLKFNYDVKKKECVRLDCANNNADFTKLLNEKVVERINEKLTTKTRGFEFKGGIKASGEAYKWYSFALPNILVDDPTKENIFIDGKSYPLEPYFFEDGNEIIEQRYFSLESLSLTPLIIPHTISLGDGYRNASFYVIDECPEKKQYQLTGWKISKNSVSIPDTPDDFSVNGYMIKTLIEQRENCGRIFIEHIKRIERFGDIKVQNTKLENWSKYVKK